MTTFNYQPNHLLIFVRVLTTPQMVVSINKHIKKLLYCLIA